MKVNLVRREIRAQKRAAFMERQLSVRSRAINGMTSRERRGWYGSGPLKGKDKGHAKELDWPVLLAEQQRLRDAWRPC